jgi:heme-degrading monooxygenase HmoA
VKPGLEEEFAQLMLDRGLPLLTAVPGVKSAKIGGGVENPSKFIFLVEWDSLESHTAFNQSAVHPEFLALFAPYAQAGVMEHFRIR